MQYTEVVTFRVTKEEWNRLKVDAEKYAGGNRTKLLRYWMKNFPRKMLTKKKVSE